MRGELTVPWPTAYKGGTKLTEGRPGPTPTSQSTRLVALLPHSDDYTQLTVVAYICYNLSKFTTMSYVRHDLILLPII